MTESAEAVLDIERIVAGGDGLARQESLVVFVPRTLGTERVRAQVTVKGRLARGALIDIERASAARVPPPCPHYDGDGCGGCQLQHAAYEEQLRVKSAIVVEAFRRIARVDIAAPVVRPSKSAWRYRRKLTLAIRRTGHRWYAGLRRYDAPDDVFELHDCLITDASVVRIWNDVMTVSRHFPHARELRGAVRAEREGGASFVLEGGDAWPRAQEFFDAVPGLRSLWWTPQGARRRRMAVRHDENVVSADASFAQVNPATADDMRAHILERVAAYHPAHVVDAYAGTGDTAHPLSRSGVRVTAIELDSDAARWAAARLVAPSRVIADRVENALADILPADLLLLNPPRTGVHERVCRTVAGADPQLRAIVYVSCDPATLARDVQRMPGWRVASLACFDMFPQTAHVETVCELVRALPEAA